jgi:hypothetical protein
MVVLKATYRCVKLRVCVALLFVISFESTSRLGIFLEFVKYEDIFHLYLFLELYITPKNNNYSNHLNAHLSHLFTLLHNNHFFHFQLFC